MRKNSSCAVMLAAALSLGAVMTPMSASAMELTQNSKPGMATSEIVNVQWRGRGRYGWRRHGGRGVGIGLGIAGAIVGGAIIANEVDRDRYYSGDRYYGGPDYADDAVGRCAAEFRSFNPNTGAYTTYEGQTVLCPYLR